MVEPSAHVRTESKDAFSYGEMRKTRVEPSPRCGEMRKTGAQIFKLLRSPRIDSKEPIRQAMQPGGLVRQPYSYSVPSPQRLLKNSSAKWNLQLMLEHEAKTTLTLGKWGYPAHIRTRKPRRL
jgi:hypothetical protein